MPSNQIPEAIHDEAARIVQAMFASAPTPGEVVSAIAPLIIEWARKDQAEKDARLIEPKSATMGTFLAGTIRAQFTPETTGGKTNG